MDKKLKERLDNLHERICNPEKLTNEYIEFNLVKTVFNLADMSFEEYSKTKIAIGIMLQNRILRGEKL